MFREFKIDVMKLQAMLESRATHGTDYDESEYQLLRKKITSHENLKQYAPDFLFVCRTLDQFWNHVKRPKFSHYDERRQFLSESFHPLLTYLEQEEISHENELIFEYDVALSFAGEDRDIVKQIAKDLKEHSISVFYDEFEKEKLWGKNLNDYFKSTYAENTRFVIPFISEHYPNKDWTNFEFAVAHAESKKRDSEFILPVRLDDTPIVGVQNSVAYLDYNTEGKYGIVNAILSKMGT